MTRLLSAATDFVQPPAAELGTAKKIAFAQAASGLYIPASTLVDENGNTLDTAAADPVGTERGLIVRTLPKKPGVHYRSVSSELTLGTAIGQNRICTLWHPATVTLIYRIKKITLYFKAKHTAGVGQYKVSFISAEAATPGGVVIPSTALNRGGALSGGTFRQAPTGAPTLVGNNLTGYTASLTAITGGMNDMMVALYTAETDKAQAIELRSGQAEGIVVYQDVTTALTTAPIVAVELEWSEEAN